MKTELMLENMSHSIAYWYTMFNDSCKCETIFPINDNEKKDVYKLLRMQYGDANVIVSPANKVYEIDKDINFELEKQTYMVFLKDVTKNDNKLEKINKIQAYYLTDQNRIKMIKCTHQMFNNNIPCAVILFRKKIISKHLESTQIMNIVKDNIRTLSYINLNKQELIRGADIVDSLNDSYIIIVLANISEINTKKKRNYLQKIIQETYPTFKFETKIIHSNNYSSFESFQQTIIQNEKKFKNVI